MHLLFAKKKEKKNMPRAAQETQNKNAVNRLNAFRTLFEKPRESDETFV
jgi:hypothetical protein